MRVLIFSDAAPDRNGVGSYYRDLRENLAPRVERIELIAPDGAHAEWVGIPLPGDSTQRVSAPSLRQIKRQFLEFQPQVVLVATPAPYGLYGGRLARKFGVPMAHGFHTHYDHLTQLYWGPFMRRVPRWYLKVTTLHLFRHAAAVLCHSDSMRKAACELGAENARLVATLLPEAFLQDPHIPQKPLERVLFVGRLAIEKRLDRLLEAADALPNLAFAIAGDGPLRGWVKDEIRTRPNVRYLGWQPRQAIPELLMQHDLLVLPSDVEAFGTVALEAMACGRTPLVSQRCGIRDWPQLAPLVYQFDTSINNALTTAIARIQTLPAHERLDTARAGHEAALTLNHDGVDDWLALLDELASLEP